jgi:Fic family protein
MNRKNLCTPLQIRLKKLPRPFHAHHGVVPISPPESGISILRVMAKHDRAQKALARAEVFSKELEDPYFISRILLRSEALSSSKIEGTNSTLDELLSLEETQETDSSSATLQVRNYALNLEKFIPLAIEQGHSIFTVNLVQNLHREIFSSDRSYKDQPGELRSRVVWIGGLDIAYSSYNPTPPEDIANTLSESMQYMRCEGMQIMSQSLIMRMAISHVHFEAVHPFRDGNGRVGRLLLPMMMAAEGQLPLYLSPYIEAKKDDYYSVLKAAQQRLEWEPAIGFIADAITGTVHELETSRTYLIALREEWLKRKTFRKGSTAYRALDILPHYPVITGNRLAKILKVTFTAATQAIKQLIKAGILEEQTGYKRNRVFRAPEVLRIINRPYGETPILPGNMG